MIRDNEIIIVDELITLEDEAMLRRIIFELCQKSWTMKIDLTFNFQIQQGGREYNCTRTVIGERFYEQFIRVEEVGSKKDAMIYRQGYSEAREKMAETARIIAHELVEEYLRKKAH